MGAAVIVAARRRRIVSHFMAQNAVSPDQAIAYSPSRLVDRRLFQRLRRAGVIRQDKHAQYYLDMPAYAADRARRRRLAGGLMAGAALVAGAAALLA